MTIYEGMGIRGDMTDTEIRREAMATLSSLKEKDVTLNGLIETLTAARDDMRAGNIK